MQVSLGSDTLSPIRLRLGTFTHRSSVLVLDAAGSKLVATISGKRIKRTSPTTNINLRPDSQTATQGTANTGPPYRLHSSHQADVYLPSDVRGSCGCSGAGSQPSRQARQSLAPPFPGPDWTEPGPIGLACVADRENNRGLEAGFFRRLSLFGTVIHLAGAMQVQRGRRQRGVR